VIQALHTPEGMAATGLLVLTVVVLSIFLLNLRHYK
jgi:hypothetical protein